MGWQALAWQQEGLMARRQLLELGVDADRVRNQVAAGRWTVRSRTVVSAVTGPLSPGQRRWLAVLHPAGTTLVAGLTSAADHGLQGWPRDDITALVGQGTHLPGRLPGTRYVRTRRALEPLRSRRAGPPTCRLEPAVLLHAASTASARAAQGLLAACVQQRLTTPGRLAAELRQLQPLRRAALFRTLLDELDGGAESLAEVDVGQACDAFGLARPTRQRVRRDRAGRRRRTDCEWDLPDGRTLVLEVDGAFHSSVEHWEDDLRRQRALTTPDRTVVRCTARELRDEPDELMHDLRQLGVPDSRRVVRARTRGSASRP